MILLLVVQSVFHFCVDFVQSFSLFVERFFTGRVCATDVGVASLAKIRGIACVALGGSVPVGEQADDDLLSFSLCNGPMALQDAISNASQLIQHQTQQIVRLFCAGKRFHCSKSKL